MCQAFSSAKIFIFPIIGRRAHYCQHSWFNTFEFLHYNVSKDTAVFVTRVFRMHMQQKKIRKAKKGDFAL